jgi:hypothetical protein
VSGEDLADEASHDRIDGAGQFRAVDALTDHS